MLWDFGLELSGLNNETAIRSKINEIDSNFDLVMVAERFDESIILLRDELCWTFQDMTRFKFVAFGDYKNIGNRRLHCSCYLFNGGICFNLCLLRIWPYQLTLSMETKVRNNTAKTRLFIY